MRNSNTWQEGQGRKSKIALIAPLVFFVVTYTLIAVGTSNPRPLEVVMSPSMAPQYKVGDLIVVRKVDPAELQIGDIIIYEIDYDSFQERILHQVWNVSIIDGTRYFALYGEMNSRPDVHKDAKDVINQPAIDSNGRRIIISLVPDNTIQGQVIYKIRYLGWPIAILISFYGLLTLIILAAFLYWGFYVKTIRSKRKGLVGLAVTALVVSFVFQGFGWSEGHIVERIELSENGFGETIELGERVEYTVSGETKLVWGSTYPTDGSIAIQVLTKTAQNMTLQLDKHVTKWNGEKLEDLNYVEQLTINHLGLVVASKRSNSEYRGFYFPFITSVNDSYIVVDAFAYSTSQVPSGILGQDAMQFVQDMQKWDYSEAYWFAPAGYLINYEYQVIAHPYILPHLIFTSIVSIFTGVGYWKIERPSFSLKINENS